MRYPVLLEEITQEPLSMMEARMLRHYLENRYLTWPQMGSAIYSDDPDGGPMRMRDVLKIRRFRIRAKLKDNWDIVKGPSYTTYLTYRGKLAYDYDFSGLHPTTETKAPP